MLQLYNNPSSEAVNNHSTLQFGVYGGSHNRVNTISAVAESAGNRKMAFTFCTDEAGSRTEKLRITGDGAISFDQGTTAAVTPSQTTATSIGHQTMSGGASWFNHGQGTDYFGVDYNPGTKNAYIYIDRTLEYLEIIDVFQGLVKATVFGFIITLIGCFQGFNCGQGARGVGKATTNAVVISSILILISNYFIKFLYFFIIF